MDDDFKNSDHGFGIKKIINNDGMSHRQIIVTSIQQSDNYKSKNRQMELEQSEIINLAVNIFQNVGIKRYIGHIDALRHEDIYFEIYKIIFPDSMINIFKISQSNLTTGQKIQKIIEEISYIIKLDLYHISGEAIAQGNRNHITNWLQLLQALSNNCIVNGNFPGGGGSEPDLDREMYKDFEEEDDYFTVQGVRGQFDKHTYTDEKADDSDDEGQYQQVVQPPLKYGGSHKKQNLRIKSRSSEQGQDELNKSFEKESDSHSSQGSNLLQPIQPNKKGSKGKNNTKKNKKVTFKMDDAHQGSNKNSQASKKVRKQNESLRKTATSVFDAKNSNKNSQNIYTIYSKTKWSHKTEEQRILQQKKHFISKMHKIQQEMQRKKINDEITNFQTWVLKANQISIRDSAQIEYQNKQRTNLISQKIAERQNFVNSLAGKQSGVETMKQIFKKQKQNQKRMRKVQLQQQRRQANELMDLRFASKVENMVMSILGQ